MRDEELSAASVLNDLSRASAETSCNDGLSRRAFLTLMVGTALVGTATLQSKAAAAPSVTRPDPLIAGVLFGLLPPALGSKVASPKDVALRGELKALTLQASTKTGYYSRTGTFKAGDWIMVYGSWNAQTQVFEANTVIEVNPNFDVF